MTRTFPFARLDDVNELARGQTGRVPWHTGKVALSGNVDILDADGNPMITCLPELAGRIVGAVNLVECAHKDVGGYRKVDEQS